MSRYYVFAVLALLWMATATSVTAQSGSTRTAKEHVSGHFQTSVVSTLSRATSANTARLNSVRIREWDGAAWADASRTEYTYVGGRRAERRVLHWDDDAYLNASRTTYEYDGAGRLVFETHYVWNSSTGEYLPESRERYLYIAEQTIASEITGLNWDEEAEGFAPMTKDTYSVELVDGRYVITGGVSYEWSPDEWAALDRFSLASVGSDVVLTEDVWSGESWVHEFRTTYSSITLTDLYDRFADLMNDLEEVEESMVMLIRLPDGLTQYWNGSDWEDASRQVTTRVYDPHTGAVAESTTLQEAFDEGEWITEMRIDLEYELVGLSSRPEALTMRIPLDEEDDFFDIYREVYAYHTSGHISNVEIHSFDWLGGLAPRQWVAYEWGETGTSIDRDEIAGSFRLEAAYPNPFNPTTTIPFTLDRPADVRITIYDAAGREVATIGSRAYQQGRHSETFDASSLASGTYFVRLSVDGQSIARAITLMK
jgi:hypothetical protein